MPGLTDCSQIFNKSLLAKFSWAMDCDPSFRFWQAFSNFFLCHCICWGRYLQFLLDRITSHNSYFSPLDSGAGICVHGNEPLSVCPSGLFYFFPLFILRQREKTETILCRVDILELYRYSYRMFHCIIQHSNEMWSICISEEASSVDMEYLQNCLLSFFVVRLLMYRPFFQNLLYKEV